MCAFLSKCKVTNKERKCCNVKLELNKNVRNHMYLFVNDLYKKDIVVVNSHSIYNTNIGFTILFIKSTRKHGSGLDAQLRVRISAM